MSRSLFLDCEPDTVALGLRVSTVSVSISAAEQTVCSRAGSCDLRFTASGYLQHDSGKIQCNSGHEEAAAKGLFIFYSFSTST